MYFADENMTKKFVFFFCISISDNKPGYVYCNSIYVRDQYNDTDVPDLYHDIGMYHS